MQNQPVNFSKNFCDDILVLDTTLRDGDQAPGTHLTPEKKLWLARKLDEAGVDVIEAGNAAVSEGERQALKAIAGAGLSAQILSFARVVPSDIDAAAQCGVDGVHLVFPSSALHIEQKLRKTADEALGLVVDCVRQAKSLGLVVELSAEDGSRADPEFLKKVFLAGAQAGAQRFCICDTVGVLTPEASYSLYSNVKKALGSRVLAVHCHNDLGLATANTLAALCAGAGEFHATVNGIGERTGNAALEEVAVGLDYFYSKPTLRLEKLYELSVLARNLSGFNLACNKPLVGENAFSHESGIHVDGLLKDTATYEAISPTLVGRKRKILLGKLSGRKAVALKLDEFGFACDPAVLEKVFLQVKALGDLGKPVTDADLFAIYQSVSGVGHSTLFLEELTASTGKNVKPSAHVCLRLSENGSNEVRCANGEGDGPVDAALNAVYKALGKADISLTEYHVDAVTGGWDAMITVSIRMRRGEKEIFSGAAGTDIVLTSAEAAIKAINALL
ncbi:MAG: 2-isopropylmalate synthase [Candidatus Micrarchaeia archaeon]